MVTKGNIEEAIKIYEQARSCWRVGLFLYLVDYALPITNFYSELRNFSQRELASLKNYQGLSPQQIEKLKIIIDKYEIGPNSVNADIVNLYETISYLLTSHDLRSERIESSLLRSRFN